jgi:hypothetical protein
MSCPIPFETLVALWAGEADDSVEEHLFECDTCAANAAQLDSLLGAMLEMIPPIVSHAQREQLAARGLVLRDLAFEPGDHKEAFFAPELDVFVFKLRGDLAAAERVDVEIVVPYLHVELPYVPFDAARGEVLVACQQHFRVFQQNDVDVPEFRVFAHSGGTRRHVGSYFIKHVWP